MPISALDFLILALASWRLAHLLVYEHGPFDLFGRLRKLCGITTITTVTAKGPETGYVASGPFAEGLLCLWCTSVWCAFLFLAGTSIVVLVPLVSFAARLLALSAASILLHELITYLRER